MQELDPNQFKEVSPNDNSAPVELDANQFKPLPSYADGSSILTPVNTSPVDAIDRAKMSFGNEAGNIKYLKSKFEDAVKDKSGELLVKDQGIWHRVDPKTFGDMDAWEATKKIASNLSLFGQLYQMRSGQPTDVKGLQKIAKEVPNAAATIPGKAAGVAGTALDIGGMAAGEAVAGPFGAAPGAGIAEGLRTSLGRLAGTYEATPEQQVKDIGWETALTLGGQGVGLGMKAGLPELRKALSTMGDSASNYAKENLSKFIGYLTDKSPDKIRWAMDNAKTVTSKAESLIGKIGPAAPRTEAITEASARQAKLVETLATEGKSALQGNYNKELGDLLKQVPKDFSANVGGMFKNTQNQIVDSGYGYIAKDGSLQIYSPAQIAEMHQTTVANLPNIIGPDTRKAMIKVADLVNQYSKFPALKGVDGAKRLVDLKKAVGQSFDEFFQDSVPKNVQQVVGGVKRDIDTQIAQQFVNHSEDLGKQYLKMNANYSARKDAVDWMNKEISNGRAENVINTLVSKAGTKGYYQGEAKSVAELLGERGMKMLNDVKDYDAAKALVEFAPGSYEGSSFKSASKFGLKVTGLTSPDRVRKNIAYSQQFLDFVKSLPPKQLKEFVGSDENLAAAITPIMQAYDGEDHIVRSLLTGSGVVPNGQQQ